MNLAKVELGADDAIQRPGTLVRMVRKLHSQRKSQRPESISNMRVTLRVLPNGELSLPREVVPKQLFRAGVSKGEWEQVWDSVALAWALAPPGSKAHGSVNGVAMSLHVNAMARKSLVVASSILRPKNILVEVKMGQYRGQDQPIGLQITLKEQPTGQKPLDPARIQQPASPIPADGPTPCSCIRAEARSAFPTYVSDDSEHEIEC